MTLSDKELQNIRKILALADREVNGRCRKYIIQNRLRKISLILRKAERRDNNLLF